MPRKVLKCVVELTLHAVTCPGTWLPYRDDVYISVCMLGQHRRSRLVGPVFPLLFHDKLRFEKVFFYARDPSQVAELMEDEHVLFELIQLTDLEQGGTLLASYENNTRDFLYPSPSLAPTYGTQDREVLMERTLEFPGISPKIEFSTKTTIKETRYPYAEDADTAGSTEEDVMVPRRTPGSGRKSRSRTRSPSPSMRQRLEELSLGESLSDSKPPFVVRKKDSASLIGRIPGSPPAERKKKKKKKGNTPKKISRGIRSRSLSPSRKTTVSEYCPHCLYPHTDKTCTVCKLYKQYTGKGYWGHSLHYHPEPHRHKSVKVIREPGYEPQPIFESTNLGSYGETTETDDYLDDPVPSYSPRHSRTYSAPAPRAPSPILYRSSLRDRFDERPYSPSAADRIRRRVDTALARSRSPSPYTSPRLRGSHYDSLDDLAVEFELARDRDRSLVHLTNGEYWTQKASQYTGKSHRELFEDNCRKIYHNMYKQARTEFLDD
ncbi:spermatogenesis-associated protein 6 [Lingula anatina]|uniref:Spermatogenesis-associated protein 6 n=1 Tax=Lingula anatina TaxID=7574 RepID=A0A1S3ILX8_LINAN|nr:spermatogenesis-associated protein 6 [Lingula anatina]|eukprot:XP_013398524.1 spermatogenesis-associated protein 6 [Lingula anatina]